MKPHQIVKAGQVSGTKVKNEMKVHLGEIKEFVVNKNLGQVTYAVLELYGDLGFDDKYFAFPWSVFSYNATEDYFILNVAKERLKRAPGFDKNKWPDFTEPGFIALLTDFYG
ncbi:MAG: PRC-barrel domain-containing protein [bacterium]|nr:PRC-barrel domain-containing protein [bacterium]